MGRYLPFAALALAAALATTSCSSGRGDTPSSTAPPSSTVTLTSPTPSGTPTTGPNMSPGEKPPEMPPSATDHTAAGALAFGGYYYKAFDWGYATNNPSLVKQISASTCNACRRYADALEQLSGKGEHVQGGRVQLQSAKLVTGRFTVKSDYVVQVVINEEPVVVVSDAHSSTAEAELTGDVSLVFVSWVGNTWKIIEVGAES